MPFYILSFLLPNLTEKEREKIEKEIEEKIKKLQGKVKERYFEKKLFAYPIKKQTKGIFGEISFISETEALPKLEEFLKFHPQILRKMIERRIEKALPKKIPSMKKKKVKIEELDKKLEELLK